MSDRDFIIQEIRKLFKEQEQKQPAVQKQQQKSPPAGRKKYKDEELFKIKGTTAADVESLLLTGTPEGMDYLRNKIPFSLSFNVDENVPGKPGLIAVTNQYS